MISKFLFFLFFLIHITAYIGVKVEVGARLSVHRRERRNGRDKMSSLEGKEVLCYPSRLLLYSGCASNVRT